MISLSALWLPLLRFPLSELNLFVLMITWPSNKCRDRTDTKPHVFWVTRFSCVTLEELSLARFSDSSDTRVFMSCNIGRWSSFTEYPFILNRGLHRVITCSLFNCTCSLFIFTGCFSAFYSISEMYKSFLFVVCVVFTGSRILKADFVKIFVFGCIN